MPLRIIKSTEPLEVKQLITVVYGTPGVGKSSLAFSADSPLLLDFDGGAHRALNRGDAVSVATWTEVTNITPEDLAPYKTLVIDTAGRALDALAQHIIQTNPKLARGGGALTLQGYGELKAMFTAWMKQIRSFGLDPILLAHSDEQRGNGDDLIERIDVTGGSKGEIYKVADLMGRLAIRNGRRVLNFSPTDTAFGKNPAQLPELEVPNLKEEPAFFAQVIKNVKGALNHQTEEQQQVARLLADWLAVIEAASTIDELNTVVSQVKATDKRVRDNVARMVVKHGKAKGFDWNVKAKAFTEKAQAA